MSKPKRKKLNEVAGYVKEDEYRAIVESATQAGMSISRFVKNCCLGVRMQHVLDAKAVRDLVAVSADLGRLGGLLKLYLTMPEVPTAEVRPLLKEIEKTKALLEQKIMEL